MANHKICFVGTEITPSDGSTFVGGHVNTVVGLCKGLTDLGWEVHIVTTPSRFLTNFEFSFPWAEFHLIHASGGHNSIRYDFDYMMKAIKTIKALYETEHIELVHGHSGYFGSSIIPALAKKMLGIPALFSLYCPASLLQFRSPLDGFGINVLANGLDKVIAVTANVKESLTKCGVHAEKIEVLHSCYDENTFNSFVSKKSEVSQESKTRKVLFVGNADKTKGLDIFLKAAKSILHTHSDVKFVVTLHEPDERLQSVRAGAFQMLGSSVEVLGVIHDMAQLINTADIVVAPFRSTSGISDIPIIVLEAMALGKPVVASNLAGVREIIVNNRNGIIVEIDSVIELVNAINTLLESTYLREEIGERALLSVEPYTISKICTHLTDLYIKTLENSR
jgi:glycosyltransferase involved in cell wall biosynthesis